MSNERTPVARRIWTGLETSPRGRLARGRRRRGKKPKPPFVRIRDCGCSRQTLARFFRRLRTVFIRDVRPEVLLQIRVLVVVDSDEPVPRLLREVLHEARLPAARRALEQDGVPPQRRRARQRPKAAPRPRGHHVPPARLGVAARRVAALDPVLLHQNVRVVRGRRGGLEHLLVGREGERSDAEEAGVEGRGRGTVTSRNNGAAKKTAKKTKTGRETRRDETVRRRSSRALRVREHFSATRGRAENRYGRRRWNLPPQSGPRRADA